MSTSNRTRNLLTSKTIISHLEFAVHIGARDLRRCVRHLNAATDALGMLRQEEGEEALSNNDCEYVLHLAVRLYKGLTRLGGGESARAAREIGHRACLIL